MRLAVRLLAIGFGTLGLVFVLVLLLDPHGGAAASKGIDPGRALTLLGFGGLLAGWLWMIKIARDAGKV